MTRGVRLTPTSKVRHVNQTALQNGVFQSMVQMVKSTTIDVKWTLRLARVELWCLKIFTQLILGISVSPR